MSPQFRGRKTFRAGPLFVHVTPASLRRGFEAFRARRPLTEVIRTAFTSWGFRQGRVTRNVTRGTTSVDTPGFGSVLFGGRKR